MSSEVSIIGAGNLTVSLLNGIEKIKHTYKINVIDIDKNDLPYWKLCTCSSPKQVQLDNFF